MSCIATSGCAWDSTNNHCYYSSTSSSSSSGSGSTSAGMPSAPSNLAAAVVPATKDVGLTWTDTASNTETFKVYRRQSGAVWGLIATQPYSLRMYTDLSLPLGTYEYYVVACVSSGCSGTSNTVFVSLETASKTIKGTVTYGDGTPVIDAKVNAWKKDTNEGKEASVGSDGSYSLSVSGGSWELYVYPASSSVNWSYNQPSKTVSFAADTSSESQTVSFVVTRTDATVKGKVLKPDGSVPNASNTYINLQSSNGTWFGGNLAADGSFTVKVAGGTYNVNITVQDSSLTAPGIPSFSVTTGETKDMGTITLVSASKTITGVVAYTDGTFVTDASVDAYQQSTGKNVHGQTNSSGTYTLSVTGGAWEVSIHPMSSNATWNYGEPSLSVSFASDSTTQTATRNFTVTKSDAAVKGKIVLPDGSPPPANAVYINIYSSTSSGGGFGGSVDANGQFRIGVPAGTYSLSLWSNNKTYTAPPIPSVTVAAGDTKDIGTITLVTSTKTITGTVSYADGRPVTDASVGAFNKSTQQWMDAMVESTGNYAMKVLGGTWEVSVHPTSQAPQWNFSQEPKSTAFKDDATQETLSLNFVVTATDATITGKIVKPDGSVPLRDMVYVNVETSDGKNFGGSLDASGSFRIPVAAGTYKLNLWSKDPALSAPPSTSVTVAQGSSVDMGTIRLMEKTDHIKGFVRDFGGKGIAGVEVNAWMPTGSGYSSIKTDTAGSFDLLVMPGEWEMHVNPDPSTNYYSSDPPQHVLVIAGTPATINFTLLVADAGISGTVVDAAGTVLSNLYGYVNLSQSTVDHGGMGGPIERGAFSFKAPAGTYSLFIFFPPESSYTAGGMQTVTLKTGETTSVKVTVAKNTSTITGILKDEKEVTVVGVEARVFATSGNGAWQEAVMDPAAGRYTLHVAAGTWYLGYDIDPKYNYISRQEPNIQVEVKEGAAVTQNLLVKKAGSTIKGKVTDPTGAGVFNAFVGVSKTSFSGAEESMGTFKDPMVASAQTDANGMYHIAVPAGSYYIKTFVSPERGFINSKEVPISIAEAETKTLDLQLRKADLAITGKVLRDGSPASGMFVWGWSDKGGYQESFSLQDGSFRLNVTGLDKWTIAAGGEVNGVYYKSSEAGVEVGSVNVVQDIHIVKYADLPKTVVQTSEATKPTVVEVEGGATVVVSANAIASSGSVQIQATPDTRAPSQGEVKVVGIAYDLSARDEAGKEITVFKSDVTVSIPYTEEGIQALGAREDNLVMSFWDETAGTWKTLENSVVNKEKNIVTATVDHFTRFAIIAAADITPPSVPTNLTAVSLATGGIQLTWSNPLTGFHHAKVYRSLALAELGTLRAVEVFTNTFTDKQDIVAGTTYFYTVRAVDAAGNESGNTGGVSIVAAASSLAELPATVAALPPGQVAQTQQIIRSLTVGSEGSDVKLLQMLLLQELVYPAGKITGYFGQLTKQAVIRFQEKYRRDILDPSGLQAGTGFVGSATRLKINQLVGAISVPSPGLGASRIERDLKVGSSGNDVSILQQLLLAEGVYPEAKITGYFGMLTRAAVIRFQEKYRADILDPNGLGAGTGFVGSATRARITAIQGTQ